MMDKKTLLGDLDTAYEYFYNGMGFLIDRIREFSISYQLSMDSIRLLSYLHKHKIYTFEKDMNIEYKIGLCQYDYNLAWKEIVNRGLGFESGNSCFIVYRTLKNYAGIETHDDGIIKNESCFTQHRERYTQTKYIEMILDCFESILDNQNKEALYANVTLFDDVAGENSDFEQFADYLKLTGQQNLTIDGKVVLIAAAGHFVKQGTMPLQMTVVFRDNEIFEKGISELVKKGLLDIVIKSSDEKVEQNEYYMLSPQACRSFFNGYSNLIRYDEVCRQATILKCDDISVKELFFDTHIINSINELSDIVSVEKYKTIVERLRERGRKCGIACLLYGAPGTGKTELVKQLARKSGRDVIIADVSKLYGMYIGESEKNFRELFRSIRYIQILSSQAPIVLFDEADGILGKRLTALRVVEKSENAIQSILLQELEMFEGIFMATTNLTCNLDPAFERRFIFKLEFPRPTPEVSRNIWKAHMQELSDMEAMALADSYTMSGGEIDNVARKCEIRYILRGSWPSLDQIREFCEGERIMTKTEIIPSRIKGFAQYSSNLKFH